MRSLRKSSGFRLAVCLILPLLAAFYVWLCRRGYGLPCLFQTFFGIPCPSCGASRAAFALLRGDLAGAIKENPLFALAIYPLGALFYLEELGFALYNVIRRENRLSFLRFLWHEKEDTP